MAASDKEIGLPALMAKLCEHHDRLEEHCERTEGLALGDELQRGIEELNENYRLLKWWMEFRRKLESLKVDFSVFSADVNLIKKLDPISREETKEQALGPYQQTLIELVLYIEHSTKPGGNLSSDKLGEEDPDQWVNNFKEDLQKYYKKIEKDLRGDNFGLLDKTIDRFKSELIRASAQVDRNIKISAEEIGKNASGLEQEARKIVGK